jgi:hypothetical protein
LNALLLSEAEKYFEKNGSGFCGAQSCTTGIAQYFFESWICIDFRSLPAADGQLTYCNSPV